MLRKATASIGHKIFILIYSLNTANINTIIGELVRQAERKL